MQRTAWLTAFLSLLVGSSAEILAQAVSVRVTRAESDAPLPGALLTLRDAEGIVLLRVLADPRGRAILRAPSPGRFTVRADGIGYRGETSEVVSLASGQVHELVFRLHEAPLQMTELVVAASRPVVCDLDAHGAELTARLWEEARKALFGTAIVRTETPVHLDVQTYERLVSLTGQIEREQRSPSRLSLNERPFVAADPADLSRNGWVQQIGRQTDYYGPDADLLLSDEFLKDHCFRAVAPDGDRIGLAFGPHAGRKVPEIAGTLWIDARSLELRSIDFTFVNLPSFLRASQEVLERLGGHVAFTRLPTGAWIVSEWNLRIPRTSQSRFRTAVVGYRDIGGEASLAGSAIEQHRAIVTGVVFDSLVGRPLVGAVVTLGERIVDTTDDQGRYRLVTSGEGEYPLTASHPWLAIIGYAPWRDSVRMVRATESRRDVTIPSEGSFHDTLCPRDGSSSNRGLLSLLIVDSLSNQPIGHVRVRVMVAGKVLPRPARAFDHRVRLQSRLQFRNEETVVEIPALSSPGAFYICGVDRSASVRVVVSGSNRVSQQWDVEDMRSRVHPVVVRVQ